jgi:hypothetical protein
MPVQVLPNGVCEVIVFRHDSPSGEQQAHAACAQVAHGKVGNFGSQIWPNFRFSSAPNLVTVEMQFISLPFFPPHTWAFSSLFLPRLVSEDLLLGYCVWVSTMVVNQLL